MVLGYPTDWFKAETMKLSCDCLNVAIHVKGTDLPPLDTTLLDLNELCLEEEFFNLKLSQVQLNLEGIAIEHKYLVNHQTVCDYVIHRCENCQMWTHAIKMGESSGKLLINASLLKDGSSTERLRSSSDYSQLFRIVLHRRHDDNRPAAHNSHYESLQCTLADIQHRMKRYLVEEEAAMEERIREFEQKQRAEYARVRSRAQQEKNDLVSLVLSESNSNGFQSPSDRSRDNSTSSENGNTRLDRGDSNSSRKTKQKAPKAREIVVDSGMDDPLFGVDGFDDSSDPFYESDDEEEDSFSEDLLSSNESGVYSTSVPISVPMWKAPQRKKSHRDEVEDERKKTPPMENMAASMQALARSVQTDGSEIFGDRPRPRLNTMDMAKIRR